MFDDYIVRFRRKVESEAATSAKIGDIIAQSTSKIDVLLEGNENAIPVIFINNDKEGETEAIMYSYSKDKVSIGKYITFLDDTYLVYKEVKNIKRENYIDEFRLILCNTSFNFNNSDVKAFFKGSLRSSSSDEYDLADNFGVESQGDAIIMYPSSITLGLNSIISIQNKGWRTTKVDSITNIGVTYAALEEYSMPDIEKVSENEDSIPAANPMIAGIIQEFSTEDGYIMTDTEITIIERTDNLVKFIIPFGVVEITISTKNNGIITSETFTVGG